MKIETIVGMLDVSAKTAAKQTAVMDIWNSVFELTDDTLRRFIAVIENKENKPILEYVFTQGNQQITVNNLNGDIRIHSLNTTIAFYESMIILSAEGKADLLQILKVINVSGYII